MQTTATMTAPDMVAAVSDTFVTAGGGSLEDVYRAEVELTRSTYAAVETAP